MDRTIINLDEATFRLVPIKQKIWAPVGSKPKLPFWFSSAKANIFGALIGGKQMFYDWYNKLNAHSFVDFLNKLIAYLPNGKYVFILNFATSI